MFDWLKPLPSPLPARKADTSGASMEPEALLIDCAWCDPYSLLDAWTIARTEGGTLDCFLRDGKMWFTVRFVAPRAVKILCYGRVYDIPRGDDVIINFNFHITHGYRVKPHEVQDFDAFIARRPWRTKAIDEIGDDLI